MMCFWEVHKTISHEDTIFKEASKTYGLVTEHLRLTLYSLVNAFLFLWPEHCNLMALIMFPILMVSKLLVDSQFYNIKELVFLDFSIPSTEFQSKKLPLGIELFQKLPDGTKIL